MSQATNNTNEDSDGESNPSQIDHAIDKVLLWIDQYIKVSDQKSRRTIKEFKNVLLFLFSVHKGKEVPKEIIDFLQSKLNEKSSLLLQERSKLKSILDQIKNHSLTSTTTTTTTTTTTSTIPTTITATTSPTKPRTLSEFLITQSRKYKREGLCYMDNIDEHYSITNVK